MRVKSDEIRRKILGIAGSLFTTNGFGAVNMSQIASAVGGSKSTLYNHFPSKELLFEAFVVEAGKERFTALSKVTFDDVDPRRTLAEFGAIYLQLVLSPEVLAINRLVIAEAPRFPDLGKIFYENGPRQTVARIESLIAQLSDRALLRPGNPHDACLCFKALLDGDLYERSLWGLIDAPDESTIRAASDHAAQAFWELWTLPAH